MRRLDSALRSSKRGLWAPFAFLALAGAAWGSVEASPVIWASSIVLLAMALSCLPRSEVPPATLPAIAVWCYAGWLVFTNAFANPGYTAAAPFHAAFLAGGFGLGRRLEGEFRTRMLAGVAAGAAVLALAGLWQVFWGIHSRAHAFFETPATLAAVLNLALLPVLVMIARDDRRWIWIALGLVLAAGAVATQSRGGFLGLAGGLAAIVFARRIGLAVTWRLALWVLAVLALGWLVAESAVPMAEWLGLRSAATGAPAQREMFGVGAHLSSVSRIELYTLALSAAEGRLLLGVGYLGFRSVFDANRAQVPSFAGGDTYFVHNDYLQTLLELGVPGLVAFVAMVCLPFLTVWRRRPAAGQPMLFVAAMLAALASMAFHAVVDFPFYVPLCLLLFGLGAGVVDRSLAEPDSLRLPARALPLSLARIAVATVAVVALVPPTIADAAASQAHRSWQAAENQSAAYWFEVARRFQPRDWRYHWYAGQFWYAQASITETPDAARFADEAFAAGDAANPRDVRNALGRIATHRSFGKRLETPADAATIRQWLDRAAATAPSHAGVLAEQARLGSGGAK